MNPVVITVDSVNPPAQGKKQANVFDTTGKRWGIDPAKMNQFLPGGMYSLTKIKSSVFQGKTYYTIDEAAPIDSGGVGAVSGYAQSTAAAPPSPRQQPAQSYGNKDQQIFVCGILNNLAGNPNANFLAMSIADKIQLVEELRYVFDVTFGGKLRQKTTGQQFDENVGDEIPF